MPRITRLLAKWIYPSSKTVAANWRAIIHSGQSTIRRDVNVLKEMPQQFVFDLAKSDLVYYYKQSIDGIEEAKKEL